MGELWAYLPGLLVLLLVSGFFSGSEAAFFSLTPSQRRLLANGSKADGLASALLARSERLLMGILFWNLAINIAYFSLVSKISMRAGEGKAALISILALMVIVIFGEFLPKSLSVTYPRSVVRFVVVPLAFSVRLVDPFLPLIRIVNEGSRRLIWPGFKSETYIEHSDLDRAIDLSTEDEHLFKQEGDVLRNIVRLSEIRVEEWMRPRTQYKSFAAPVSIEQLQGEKTPSGYMLINDSTGRDVQFVIDLGAIRPNQESDLTALKQPLVVVPWCCSVAEALDQLKKSGKRVAVVVNEFGESIGILTWEEIFEAILQAENTRSQRALAKAEIREESPGVWLATGLTKIRRLERVLGQRFEGQNLTIGGVIQEQLQRLAEEGDRCDFETLHIEVIEAGIRGEILVRITTNQAQGDNA